MADNTIQVLPPKQAGQLIELAERAKVSLNRFTGNEIEYTSVGLQMLDEWIDRHLKQFPAPSNELIMVWGAFLGEVFRRKFKGEWGVNNMGRKPHLGIICPREEDPPFFVDVMDQIQRRIKDGMSESLAFYYTLKGVEIRS